MKKLVFRKKTFIVASALIILGGLYVTLRVGAFTGPSGQGGTGAGAVASDAANNVAIGTSTVSSTVRLMVLGSTTDSSYFSFDALSRTAGPLLLVRNDGKVSVATSSFSTTSTLRVAGYIEAATGGFVFPDGSVQTVAGGGGTSTPAANVTAGAFGSAGAGGNYSFPANLAIGTSTAAARLHVKQGSSNVDVIRIEDNDTTDRFGIAYVYQNPYTSLRTNWNGTDLFSILSNGNVGIGTSTPQALLSVGTATSGLVAIFGGGSGKIDVGTVDPVYTILGKRYATYMAGMVGVKEETTGVAKLRVASDKRQGIYEYVIDFANEPEGSDLWLFSKVTRLKDNFDKLTVLLTPGFEGSAWYKKDAARQTLTIFGSAAGEVSYRLTAPRFDAAAWSNMSDSQSEGFVINE